MATMKEIAQKSGVSTATVSYVLNGKGKLHHIPPETQERICSAAKELNYKARASRARKTPKQRPFRIAVLWPTNYRSHEVSSVISGIDRIVSRESSHVYINFLLFPIGALANNWAEQELSKYDGLVLFALTPEDLAFLDGLQPKQRIVLVNRKLQGFSSVSADQRTAGRIACDKLVSVCGPSISAVVEDAFYLGRSARTSAFRERAKELGISLEQHIYPLDYTFEAGYRLGLDFLEKGIMTKGIYFSYDHAAAGFISALCRNGFTAGKDYYLLAVGMGSSDVSRFSRPSITCIDLKLEELTERAISMCVQKITSRRSANEAVIIPPQIIFRESLPEIRLNHKTCGI